jgi:hypothetical protein
LINDRNFVCGYCKSDNTDNARYDLEYDAQKIDEWDGPAMEAPPDYAMEGADEMME